MPIPQNIFGLEIHFHQNEKFILKKEIKKAQFSISKKNKHDKIIKPIKDIKLYANFLQPTITNKQPLFQQRYKKIHKGVNQKCFCTCGITYTLSWAKSLEIPVTYNKQINFEIYEKHQFGYNPQQLKTILYGALKVEAEQKSGKWAVHSSAEDHKKIGYLFAEVKKEAKKVQKVEPITISSILIRKLKHELPRGYVLIKNNQKILRTPSRSAVSKELLFLENCELGKLAPDDNIIFELYTEKDKQVARAYVVYQDCHSSNRLDLYSSENNQHEGQLYFQLEKAPKEKKLASLTPKRRSSQPNLFSHFQKLQNKQEKLFPSRYKKISVLHSNGDVLFPKEERFMIYQDKQTDIISYSRLNSFKFLDNHSKKYYRGASIGKGEKTNFTTPYRYNPGVGNYRLPSIFDRY